MNGLEEALRGLLKRQPLHFATLYQMQRRITLEEKPYFAAVWMNTRPLTLEVTPSFFRCSLEERQVVLIHEVEHLYRQHALRVLEGKADMAWRFGTDLAINQDVPGLPDGVITLDLAEEMVGERPPEHETAEFYADWFRQHGLHEMEGDMHCDTGWEGVHPDVLKELVKELGENAKRMLEGMGRWSAAYEEKLAPLFTVENPWPAQIQRFVASTVRPEVRMTWMKRHRRVPDWKGKRRLRAPNLLVMVDTSGSMSTETLNAIAGHLAHLKKTGVEVWVMEIDAEIQAVYPLKDFPTQMHGRGGTNMNPGLAWAVDRTMEPYVPHRPASFDGVIVLTDGDIPTVEKPSIPVLWGLPPGQRRPYEGAWTFVLPGAWA